MARSTQNDNPEAVREYRDGEPLSAEEIGEINDPRIIKTRLSMAIIGCNPDLSKLSGSQLDTMNIPHKDQIILQAKVYGKMLGLTDFRKYKPTDEHSTEGTHGLVGIHEAVNMLTGEFFKGGVVYLPGDFHSMQLSELRSILERRAEGDLVEYGWDVFSEPAGSIAGYAWRFINLMPLRRDDPLASLRRRVLAGSTVKTPLLMQQDAPAAITDRREPMTIDQEAAP